MSIKKRVTIYYEFYKIGDDTQLQGTGTRVLGNTSITTGVDTVPTMSLTIPLEDLPEAVVYKDGEPNLALYLLHVYIHTDGVVKYKFIGTIDNMNIDYANYSITMNLSHRVARMREWLMPSGFVCKNMPMGHLIGPEGLSLGDSSTISKDTQTYEATVEFEFQDDTDQIPMEMSFSSTDKLSALNEIMKNTHDAHFIVDLGDNEGDKIIIGKFGGDSGVFISSQPFYEEEGCVTQPENYLTMLTEPQYNVDYTSHFNRAAVFCGDLAESVMHLTLKEVYDRPAYQKDVETYENSLGEVVAAFPVSYYDKQIELQPEPEYKPSTDTNKKYNTTKINNEKVYENLDVVAYADNTNREYYVTDARQLEEDGIILHTVYNFSDLHPIPELEESVDKPDGTTEVIEHPITDNDRWEIAKRAYLRAIRVLKAQRPEKVWQFNTTPLPHGFQVGDLARLYYVKKVVVNSPDCAEDGKEKELARVDKTFYVTKVTMSFDEEVNETDTITLDNELRYRDTTSDEWKLTGSLTGGNGGSSEMGHGHDDVWDNNLNSNG